MEELNIMPTEEQESGESQDAEGQALDDATHEPRTFVEQSGDYQQAEAIQAALTEVVENLGAGAENEGATPLPIPQPEDGSVLGSQPGLRGDLDQATSDSGGSGRDEATPINLPDMRETMADDKGASPLPIPRPEEQGLAESQSEVRGDLGEAETGEASKGGDEATPINLPGPQQAGEAPEPGPHPFPHVAHEEGETQVGGKGLGEQPVQADFEKPILQEGLVDKGLGDGSYEDLLTSMIPGSGGKIEGGPGGQDMGSDPLDDLLSGKSVPGGVDMGIGGGKLNFDPEGQAGEGHMFPGTNSPFAPGKGPGGGIEMEGGGKKDDGSDSGGKKDSGGGKGGQKDGQTYPAFVVESNKAPKDAGTAFYDSKTGDFYFSTVQGVLERSADLINMEAANILDGKGGGKTSSETTTTEDGDSGGPDRDTPDPKYDGEQISLHTADGTGAPPTPGGSTGAKDVQFTEEGQKRVKRALENMSKLRSARKVKPGSELITDPPEHDPKPKGKSESAGKEG